MLKTTRPIPLDVVQKIKQNLQDDPRSLAYFVVLCNSNMRCSDLLGMTRENIRYVEDQIEFFWTEKKSGKNRRLLLNSYASGVLKRYLDTPHKTEYLFEGTRGKMNSSVWSVRIKEWCKDAGFDEPRVANHSCRKTWCRTMYENKVPMYVISEALNHESERTTRIYMGLMSDEVSKVFRIVV